MDAADLREFYGSRLGQATRRLIARRIAQHWPDHASGTVMGMGFPTPYLEAVSKGADRTLAFMPAQRGVLHWPDEGSSASALVDELELPLVESVVDRALLVHALELTDDPEELLREVWRVMSPQGRLLIVAPNRRGMWARFDSTPFGYGQPFSRPQILKLLKETEFSAVGWSQALYFPPFERALALRSAVAWERLGAWLSPPFSGVILVEATKQVYARPKAKRVRRLLPRLKPVLAPQLKPSYEGHSLPRDPHTHD